MDFSELNRIKDKGQIKFLPVNRKARRKSAILSFLGEGAFSAKELAKKMNVSQASAYNSLRRLEKDKGLLKAFDYKGETYFIEKQTALKMGLIETFSEK